MKFNLKTCPKSPMRCEEFAIASKKWFEGFEKELREMELQYRARANWEYCLQLAYRDLIVMDVKT